MISIVIAEDQAVIRAGLRMLVDAEDDLEVVGEAEDGHAAIRHAGETASDLVLMDLQMPNLDGITATRRLTEKPGNGPKVLVLTTFDLDEYVYDAIHAGASGFLLKTAPPSQLIAAIHAVMAGDTVMAPQITRRLVNRFCERPLRVDGIPPALAGLSEREIEVLRLIADGRSNAEIAERLVLSAATVKSHVNHILTKLRLRDRVQAVVAAYRSGLITGTPA
jgi:DNA-binding NarL/FixJ family response regulator